MYAHARFMLPAWIAPALVAAVPCAADTVTLVHGRDGYEGGATTFISYFDPDDALGGLPTIRIRSTDVRKALVRFGGLDRRFPEGFVVEGATLRLHVTTCRNPEGSDITVHRVLSSWDAQTATWHERRAGALWAAPGMAPGRDFDARPMGAVRGPDAGFTGWIEMPLEARGVQEWFTLPGENFGVVLKVVARGQPGVDDQFYGNAHDEADLRPQLVLTGGPGTPPEPVIELHRLLEAEFIAAAYVNRDAATLVFEPRPLLTAPMDVQVSFTERADGRAPTAPLGATVAPGSERTRLVVPIGDWPDGEYLARIRRAPGPDAEAGETVRVLRKQTIARPSPPPGPQDVAGLTTLMVDDRRIAERRGLRFVAHPARLFTVTTGALAEHRVQQRGLGLRVDDDGAFVVHLRDADRYGRDERHYEARSTDLAQWEITPRQEAVGGVGPRLVRTADGQAAPETFRFYDPERDGPPALARVRVRYSRYQDTHWGEIEIPARVTFPVWEKAPGEMVILTREPLTEDRVSYQEGDLGDWRHTNDNFGGQWLSGDGTRLHFCQGRAIPRFPPFRIGYDNLWAYNRILAVWTTEDGLDWTPTFFDVPTEADPVGYQHYGAATFPAEGGELRLGYLYAYNQATQQIWLEATFSRDSIHWERLDAATPLAPNGPPGAWNFGHMHPVGPSVERDGVVYQLLGYCSNAPHFMHEFIYNRDDLSGITPQWLRRRLEGRRIRDWPFWDHYGSWEALAEAVVAASQTVGIMAYRKDGWASLSPEDAEGVLVTEALRAGAGLTLNARTAPNGRIRVEVLDAHGAPLEAYCGDNAAVFEGDAIASPLAWSGGRLTQLPDEPLRLRIHLQRAHLYALGW